MQHQVRRVVAGVDQLAATASGSVCAPAHVLRVEVVVEAVGGVNLVDLAENTLIEQLLGSGHRGQIELIVGTHQGHTRGAHRPLHRGGLLNSEAERLFTQNVLACFSSGHDGLGVQVVRQADVDGVEVSLADHLPKVGVRRGAELGRASLGGLGHHISNRCHLDHVGVGAVTADMSSQDAATTDRADFDRAHTALIR